jgi:hypothetical protein
MGKGPHGRGTNPQNKNSQTPDNQSTRGMIKALAGINSTVNALYNEYKANSKTDNARKSAEGNWVRGGAIAAIGYAGLTIFIVVATGYQAWTARDQERHQLRAYLGVERIEVDCCSHVTRFDVQSPADANVMRVWVKNFGETPASDVRVRILAATIPFNQPFPNNFNFAIPASHGPPVSFPFAEGSIYDLPTEEHPFLGRAPEIDFMAAQESVGKEIIFGHVEFTDIFSDRRYVDFCQIYYRNLANQIQMDTCPQHNGEAQSEPDTIAGQPPPP